MTSVRVVSLMWLCTFVLLANSPDLAALPPEGDESECAAPAWVAKTPRDGRLHGVAAVEVGANRASSQAKAIVAALKGVLLNFSGADGRLVSLLSLMGRRAAPDAKSAVATEVALGADEETLLGCVSPKKGVQRECWNDPCSGQLWCHVSAPHAKLEAVAHELMGAADLDGVLEAGLRKLAARADPSALKLAVYQVVHGDVAGDIGIYLSKKVGDVAAAKNIFEVVSRPALDAVFKAEKAELGQLGPANPGLNTKVGGVVDLILLGSYEVSGQVLNLDLMLVDSRGSKRGAVTVSMFMAALPAEVRQVPKRESDARAEIAKLKKEQEELRKHYDKKLDELWQARRTDTQVAASSDREYEEWLEGATPDSPLVARAYVDRGCGSTYEVGEELVVFVRCNKDCYVKLYHRAADGDVNLILPNKFDADNHLKGGVVHAIGDATYPFKFDVTLPTGIEMVTVVASENQFEDLETVRQETGDGLANYGKLRGTKYRGILTRGLSVSARKSGGAGASLTPVSNCSFSVVGRPRDGD